MIRNISTGIDIGSSTIRVVVGEFIKGEKIPKIIGVGESPSVGVRHGYITSPENALRSLKNAIQMAEKSSGVKIRRAYVSLNSTTLRSEISIGEAIVSKADGEVTILDVNKSVDDAENNLNLNNKKVIHYYPISFELDGKEVLGKPEGMRGTKLKTRTLFVTCSSQHVDNLLEVVTKAKVEPIDVVASPISGSYIALSEKQKIVGVALVNIGAETVSLSVFENSTLVSLYTFSIGSSDITNDIALGFKIPLEEADQIKLGNAEEKYPQKKINEIVDARLSDIFELIDKYLKKIKRSELLPAGIIWIGGGANTPNLETLSREALRLPSRSGSTDIFSNNKTKLRDLSWFTALGLIMKDQDSEGYTEGSFPNILKDIKRSLRNFSKQLMP